MSRITSRLYLSLLALGVLSVACNGDDGPRPDPSPTVPGAGTGTGGAGGHGPSSVPLGSASNFAILAKTGISTVPTSQVTGDIGISPAAATAITGFALNLGAGAAFATSSQVNGQVFAPGYAAPTPSVLTTAVTAMEAAYDNAAGRTVPDHLNLASGNLGGLTLPAGLYKFTGSVSVPTNVTLSGSSTDVWIFQIAGGLTVAANKHVLLAGGALASNVFWQVAGTVTVGTSAHIEGEVLSKTNIAMRTGSTINGRLLAQTAVTIANTAVVKQ